VNIGIPPSLFQWLWLKQKEKRIGSFCLSSILRG
jgi:hypothetical protein